MIFPILYIEGFYFPLISKILTGIRSSIKESCLIECDELDSFLQWNQSENEDFKIRCRLKIILKEAEISEIWAITFQSDRFTICLSRIYSKNTGGYSNFRSLPKLAQFVSNLGKGTKIYIIESGLEFLVDDVEKLKKSIGCLSGYGSEIIWDNK